MIPDQLEAGIDRFVEWTGQSPRVFAGSRLYALIAADDRARKSRFGVLYWRGCEIIEMRDTYQDEYRIGF